jgi:hypothetical protein
MKLLILLTLLFISFISCGRSSDFDDNYELSNIRVIEFNNHSYILYKDVVFKAVAMVHNPDCKQCFKKDSL